MIINIQQHKFLFFYLTYFLKVYKITRKKKYLKQTYGKIKITYENNVFDIMLVLLYSRKIGKKIIKSTLIIQLLNDFENSSQKVFPEITNEFKDLEKLINLMNIGIESDNNGKKTHLINQKQYNSDTTTFKLNSSSYINKVHIKITSVDQAKYLLDKYVGFHTNKKETQMLGFFIIYTKGKDLMEKKALFLYQ